MQAARILITGASGLVGSYLLSEMKGDYVGNIYATVNKSSVSLGRVIEQDLAQTEEVLKMLDKLRPDIILNLAALTNVDQCETDPTLATRLNRDLVTAMSKYVCKNNRNAYILHVSTDYVFDGADGNYYEESPTGPVNWYGITKLQGENELSKKLSDENWCIARTSTPFGIHPRKQCFPLFVIDKLRKSESIHVLTDQVTSPTHGTNLAKMLKEIVDRRVTGIIHISGASRLSRYNQAVEISKLFGLDRELILKIDMDQMPWKAKRPKDSSLNVHRARKVLNNKPEFFDQALKLFAKEIP